MVVSPFIAFLIAELIPGNHGRHKGMSPTAQVAVNSFWECDAFIVNSLVSLLIGLEIQVTALSDNLGAITQAVAAFLGLRTITDDENDSRLCRVGARRVALAVSSGSPRAEHVCPSRPSPNPLCKFPSDGLSRERLPTRDVTIARVIPAPFLPLPLSSFARNSPRC